MQNAATHEPSHPLTPRFPESSACHLYGNRFHLLQ